MAQATSLAAFAENFDFIPSIHMASHSGHNTSQEIQCPFIASGGTACKDKSTKTS